MIGARIPPNHSSQEQLYSDQLLNRILLESSTFLSMVGCLLIIGTYVMYKDIRTPSRHIIVCISISDFIVAMLNFMISFADFPSNGISENICILRSYLGSIALLWSFLWTMALSIFLNILIVQKNPQLADSLIHKVFHPALVINLVALCSNKLGNSYDMVASGWCWIALDVNRK